MLKGAQEHETDCKFHLPSFGACDTKCSRFSFFSKTALGELKQQRYCMHWLMLEFSFKFFSHPEWMNSTCDHPECCVVVVCVILFVPTTSSIAVVSCNVGVMIYVGVHKSIALWDIKDKIINKNEFYKNNLNESVLISLICCSGSSLD